MKLKALLLATAGAAVATSASAADLPVVAEPVDYVQVCDAYGAGFFKIPGKDTCLKIGGRIRTQIVSDNLTDDRPRLKIVDSKTVFGEKVLAKRDMDYSAYARGYLYLTSMTDTEIGLIKTYTEFYSEWDQDGTGSSKVGSAYLQIGADFADILIGRTTSQFDAFTGAVDVGVITRNWSDQSTLQIAMMKSLGNGVSVALSAEDSSYRDGDVNSADIVGKIGIAQGWGSFEVAAAYHDTPDGAKEDSGYAVRGTATINLDMIAPGDKFIFQAAYADSALSYLGTGTTELVDVSDGVGGEPDTLVTLSDSNGAEGYTLGAGFTHFWTPEVATSIDGSYLSLEQDNIDYDRWAIDGSIGWYPVSGLVIALDAGFANEDWSNGTDSADFDDAKVGARVQYTF
ncbi:porin [Pseudovibrio exalbescens]|uniref:porin n=1 Tax=Pseudovibrio exalbescens TaxID=197461 RepID=UPI000C9B9C98|nr:porin [Pseudovibrio exalbescens]